MKSIKQYLTETILGSTRTGRITLIEEWAKKYWGSFVNQIWQVNSDGKVVNSPGFNIILFSQEQKGKIPDYVQFGECTGDFYADDLSELSNINQLPSKCNIFYLSGSVVAIDEFTTPECKAFSLNDSPRQLKKINKALNIKIIPSKILKDIIFANCGLSLEDFQKIHISGAISRLHIDGSPAAETIIKQLKKIKGKDEELQQYCQQVFSNIDSLRFVKLTSRTQLEHNQKLNKWILF